MHLTSPSRTQLRIAPRSEGEAVLLAGVEDRVCQGKRATKNSAMAARGVVGSRTHANRQTTLAAVQGEVEVDLVGGVGVAAVGAEALDGEEV